MTKNSNLMEYQIKDIKEDVVDLKKDMKLILENHLPHLNLGIKNVRTEVRVMFGVNLILVILTLLLTKII